MSNVKYHFARNSFGEIIDIKDVQKGEKTTFYCIECGDEMSAVLGDKREHHFRHKNSKCSYESYLHKLGKEHLKKLFDESEKFEIHNCVEFKCDKNCELNCKKRNSLPELIYIQNDLKSLYDKCEVEKEYKGFIADLLLTSSKNPDIDPIFLEISHTHDCEQEKLDSGIKIIELKVKDDRDLKFKLPLEESDRRLNFKDRNIRFYNFCHKPSYLLFRCCVSKPKDGIVECSFKTINCYDSDRHDNYKNFLDITVDRDDEDKLRKFLPQILLVDNQQIFINNGVGTINKSAHCLNCYHSTQNCRDFIRWKNSRYSFDRLRLENWPYRCQNFRYTAFGTPPFPYKIWKNPDFK